MTQTKKPELQVKLQEALGLPDSDFHCRETDLYVVARPGVLAWLNDNYEHYDNITAFVGQDSNDWAGLLCLDIPFAGNWPSKSFPDPDPAE